MAKENKLWLLTGETYAAVWVFTGTELIIVHRDAIQSLGNRKPQDLQAFRTLSREKQKAYRARVKADSAKARAQLEAHNERQRKRRAKAA